MTSQPSPRIVVVIGSAPDALRARDWPRTALPRIVAVNNAWRVRDDWDYLLTPDDFPPERLPPRVAPGQSCVGSAEYVKENNAFGGVFYAGGTMAFSAGYWALSVLKPDVMAFLGCDMVYPAAGRTHFYGRGTPDPLRADPSLRSLEAKSARLMLLAARRGCACVRLSAGESRLLFAPAPHDALASVARPDPEAGGALVELALERERQLGYFVGSGRYWEEAERFDPAEVDALDRLWLEAAGAGGAAADAASVTAMRALRSRTGSARA